LWNIFYVVVVVDQVVSALCLKLNKRSEAVTTTATATAATTMTQIHSSKQLGLDSKFLFVGF
jgi:hypothetical protein